MTLVMQVMPKPPKPMFLHRLFTTSNTKTDLHLTSGLEIRILELWRKRLWAIWKVVEVGRQRWTLQKHLWDEKQQKQTWIPNFIPFETMACSKKKTAALTGDIAGKRRRSSQHLWIQRQSKRWEMGENAVSQKLHGETLCFHESLIWRRVFPSFQWKTQLKTLESLWLFTLFGCETCKTGERK